MKRIITFGLPCSDDWMRQFYFNNEGNKAMRGLIILDGPDTAGKTTLAEAIATRAQTLGGEAVVAHLGKPPEGECWRLHTEALCQYIQKAFNENKVVIADRHFMSEGVYGDTYRHGSEYPFASRHIDRALHRFRALRVICAPPVSYVVNKLEEMKKLRHEDYHEGMEKVAQRYLDLWEGTDTRDIKDYLPNYDYLQQLSCDGGTSETIGWYHYDVTQHGSDLKAYTSFLLQEMADETDLLPDELYYFEKYRFTGFPTQQSVLLVGDKISADNPLFLPFFANSASSHFLARALHWNHVDESRLVIANVNDRNGVETVRLLSQLCGRVVVMGRQAERATLQYGLSYDAVVRHPQHAARFDHHNESYAHELNAVLQGWAGVKAC